MKVISIIVWNVLISYDNEMLCYIYCLLAAAYAETACQLNKNAAHLKSHKGAFCVLTSFQVRSSKEASQVHSLRSLNWETAKEYRIPRDETQ